MNFFKRKTSWSVAEFILIKCCLVSGGIAAGIWLYKWLNIFAPAFFLFYLATGFVFFGLWLNKAGRKK